MTESGLWGHFQAPLTLPYLLRWGTTPQRCHEGPVSVQPRAAGVHLDPGPHHTGGCWWTSLPAPSSAHHIWAPRVWVNGEGGLRSVTLSARCAGWRLLSLTDSASLSPKVSTHLNQWWLHLYPQRTAINVGYNVTPRNFRRFSVWSTGCSLHDLISSQAAYGKASGGRDALAYYGDDKCLAGYTRGLCSRLSNAELTLRLSKMFVGFKTGSSSFPWSNEQGHAHQVMPWGQRQQSLTSDLGEAVARSDLHLLLGAAYVWRLQAALTHWASSVHTEAWLI